MNISTQSILKVLFVTAAFIGLIYAMYLTRTVLTWIIMSFALALALNPAVATVSRYLPRRNRVLATLIVFFVMLFGLTVLAVALWQPVATQTQQLVHNVPTYTKQLSEPGTAVGDFVNQYDLIGRVQDSQSEIVNRLTNASGTFVGVLAGVLSSLIAVISILGLTFFMLMEGPVWLKMFWEVVPKERRGHFQGLAGEMYQAMVGYVNGKLLAAILAGLTAAIAMMLVNVPYAATLAVVVALFSIIPVFGATVGAVIVVIVSLFTGVNQAVFMAIFFFVYQQVENNVIQPVIFKKTIDVSPLLAFVSVLIGTAAAGILGALIAIPITASVQILVRDFYSRRGLEAPSSRRAKAALKA